MILAADDAGYAALSFSVAYAPGPGPVEAAVAMEITGAPQPVELALTGPQATSACLSVEGELHFESELFGVVSKKVSVCNFGPPLLPIQDIYFDGDSTGTHWAFEPDLPAYAIPANDCLEFEVIYTGSDSGLNATMQFVHPGGMLSIPAWGGPAKPLLDFAPGTASDPGFVNDRFVLYNRGNGPLDVTAITLQRPGKEDQDVFAEVATIDAFGSWLVVLEDVQGAATLEVAYTDENNDAEVLTAEVLPTPVSVPALEAPCAGIRVGQVATLSAAEATSGQWHVIAKPEGSQLVINGAGDPQTQTFRPDVEGAYEIGVDGGSVVLQVAP